MKALCVVSCILVTCVTTAQAKVVEEGIGGITCPELINLENITKTTNMRLFAFSWAEGFLAGLNLMVPYEERVDMNTIEIEAQVKILDVTCATHSSWTYVDAIISMYNFMRNKRGLVDLKPDFRS